MNDNRGNWLVLLGYADLSNNITNTLMLLEHLKVDYLSSDFRLWISWDSQANNVIISIECWLIFIEFLNEFIQSVIGKWSELLAAGEHPLPLLWRREQRPWLRRPVYPVGHFRTAHWWTQPPGDHRRQFCIPVNSTFFSFLLLSLFKWFQLIIKTQLSRS